MQSHLNSNLRIFSNLLFAAPALATIIGLVDTYSYYQNFSFNILPYLSLNELLVAFLNVYLPIILGYFFYITYFLEGVNSSRAKRRILALQHRLSRTHSISRRLRLIYKYYPLLAITLTILALMLLPAVLLNDRRISETCAYIWYFDAYWLLSLIFIRISVEQLPIYKLFDIFFIALFVIWVSITFYTRSRYNNIVHEYSTLGVEMTLLDGSAVKSDSIYLYIGKTSEYTFFFNKESKTHTVYSNSSILYYKE